MRIGTIEMREFSPGVLSPIYSDQKVNQHWLETNVESIWQALQMVPIIRAKVGGSLDVADYFIWNTILPNLPERYHKDSGLTEYEAFILYNSSNNNRRGSTRWVDFALLDQLLADRLEFLEKADVSPEKSFFKRIIDDFKKQKISNYEFFISLQFYFPSTYFELQGKLDARAIRIDWSQHPGTLIIVNNERGLHRGDYNKDIDEEDEANFLYRRALHSSC